MGDFFNSKELLIDGISILQSNKIPSPELDARILLSYAINFQNTIYTHNNILISEKEKTKFYFSIDERIQGNYGGNFTVLIKNSTFPMYMVKEIDSGTGLWYHNGAAGDINGDCVAQATSYGAIWLCFAWPIWHSSVLRR